VVFTGVLVGETLTDGDEDRHTSTGGFVFTSHVGATDGDSESAADGEDVVSTRNLV